MTSLHIQYLDPLDSVEILIHQGHSLSKQVLNQEQMDLAVDS